MDDPDPRRLRLLGSYDLFLQGRDRGLILPDKSQHKALWPVIGRPGAVLSGVEIIGTWRPKTTGTEFTLRLDLWAGLPRRSEVGSRPKPSGSPPTAGSTAESSSEFAVLCVLSLRASGCTRWPSTSSGTSCSGH